MPFKLDKKESKRRADLIERLQERESALEDAVNVFNTGLETLREALRSDIARYNEVISEARGFAEDIASQADSDFDEKSERWQEGDKGQAASQWRSEWENAGLDDVEIEYPADFEFEDESKRSELLEALPEEMSE